MKYRTITAFLTSREEKKLKLRVQSRRTCAFAIILLAFSVATNARASGINIVQNPGFEDSSSSLLNWTSSGFIPYTASVHSGSFSAWDTNCAFGCADFLSQILTTGVGTVYDLTFWAETQNVNSATPNVQALWNGSAVFNQSITAGLPWAEFTVLGLTATNAATTLEFTIQPGAHLVLDDVSVSAEGSATTTPEPGTFPLAAAATMLLVLIQLPRKRRRAGEIRA